MRMHVALKLLGKPVELTDPQRILLDLPDRGDNCLLHSTTCHFPCGHAEHHAEQHANTAMRTRPYAHLKILCLSPQRLKVLVCLFSRPCQHLNRAATLLLQCTLIATMPEASKHACPGVPPGIRLQHTYFE